MVFTKALMSSIIFVSSTCLAIGGNAEVVERISTDNTGKATALMSYPDFFCGWTELSTPHAYVIFAIQSDGLIKYFRTKTTCRDFKQKNEPLLVGETIAIIDDQSARKVIRESGDTYEVLQIQPSEVGHSWFDRTVFSHEYAIFQKPYGKYLRPQTVITECRRLKNSDEHDACLWYQAGFLSSKEVCREMSESARGRCLVWIDNIEKRKTNH